MIRNPMYIYGQHNVQVPAKLHFGEFILQKMWERKEKVALINGSTGDSITFGQIAQQAMNFAISLSHIGVRKGQTVAICSENRLEFWGAVVGAVCTGATVTTVNPGYSEGELIHVVDISKPTYMILSSHCYKLHGKFFKSLPYVKKIILIGNEKVDNTLLYSDLAITNKDGTGDVIIKNSIARNVKFEEFEVADVDGQTDVLFILYSSGTTGLPKGAMLAHVSIIVQCLLPQAVDFNRLSLTITPWYHVMGLVSCLIGLAGGMTSVFLPKFEVDLFLRTIEKYKIVQVTLVPPVVLAVSKAPGVYDLSSVEMVNSGAAPLYKETSDLLKTKFPNIQGVFQGYGMTESGLVVTRFTNSELKSRTGIDKLGSVGRVMPWTTVKVLDLETNEPLGPNKPGEICFKSVSMMKGYVGKDRSADFDQEGFFRTGDVGYYDEDGCFYIVDRLKELIKYKGYQVPPAELEALLVKHEAIRDAGVVGIPDDDAGEVPLAFVVTQPGRTVTEKEVQQFVAERLSNPKHLRGGVRFLDAIPKSASGKILRKNLRQIVKSGRSKL